MDFTRQSPRASQQHSTHLAGGTRTCIDCHKGIAHRLPNLQGTQLGDVCATPRGAPAQGSDGC
jgi:nitrate/TMAO reductase-like tetraheme cytochrome c subunit